MSFPYYATRDASHGIEHVEKVADTTLQICQMEKFYDQVSVKVMLAAAFLHDAYDHKYIGKDNIP